MAIHKCKLLSSKCTSSDDTYINITIEDCSSHCQIFSIKLDLEQFGEFVTCSRMQDVDVEVTSLDLLGKKRENRQFTFEINFSFADRPKDWPTYCQQMVDSLPENKDKNWLVFAEDVPNHHHETYSKKLGKATYTCNVERWL